MIEWTMSEWKCVMGDNIYLLFNQRSTFAFDVNNGRDDTPIATIDVDEMYETINIFENCIDSMTKWIIAKS